ncbi:MAG: hypothetical protein ABW200_05625, partial [Hyphomicrobiaceae bacterium]
SDWAGYRYRVARPTQRSVILPVFLFACLPGASECDGVPEGLRIMRAVAASTTAILAICFAGQAFAATVRATGGQVLINRGEGYKMVAGTIQGGPGDTIVANPGGSAQIVYPDGCVIDVLPGSVAVINAQSPCSASNATVTSGSATTTSTTPEPLSSDGGGGSGISGTALALGAVAVGGGVGAAMFLGKDKSSSP